MNSSPRLSTLSTTSSPSSSTPSIPSSVSSTPEVGSDLLAAEATPRTELDRASCVSTQSLPLFASAVSEGAPVKSHSFSAAVDREIASAAVWPAAADATTAASSAVSTPDLGLSCGTGSNFADSGAGTLPVPVPSVAVPLGNGQIKGPALSPSVGLPSATPSESIRAPGPPEQQQQQQQQERKQRSRVSDFLQRLVSSKISTSSSKSSSSATPTRPPPRPRSKLTRKNRHTFSNDSVLSIGASGAGGAAGAAADYYYYSNNLPAALHSQPPPPRDRAASARGDLQLAGACAPPAAARENVVLHAPAAPAPAPAPALLSLSLSSSPASLASFQHPHPHHHHLHPYSHHHHHSYNNFNSSLNSSTTHINTLSRSPSLSSAKTSRSHRPRSLPRLRSRRSSSASDLSIASTTAASQATPAIFRSTAACRLSVPVEALRDLQTISEHDISRKMHQTSSRLLRMTEDERPYTRDFKDLFSTLMVSLPLTPHRVRFQRVDHTFTSEEAITNLGSLKFSQSNRMPDPKDPSRIVTTTTTTTFSMAREMAKSVCQKFLEARFIESVDNKNDFSSKSAVWQLTPKGMHILQRFCSRNGINQRHVQMVLESPRNTMHLVLLEREADGDRIHRDQPTIEVVFRRFVGQEGPNLKWSTANSDSDSVTDYQTGLIGVKMARERKIGDKTYWNTFTGKAAVDWLMDCSTMVDKRETVELASMFVDFGLIHPVEGTVPPGKFSPQKSSIYFVTDKGQKVAGWIPSTSKNGTTTTDSSAPPKKFEGKSRDSNANSMTIIIKDPALRLLFREFLRDTHCEENLAFYLDVKEFLANYQLAKQSAASALRLDTIRETLAAAYSLYNAFLAPGSPCELNIDHSLRTALAARMTRAVGDDEATIASLDEVAGLFDQAQTSVFKLMASDSVPKFMREPKYVPVIRERNLDAIIGSMNATAAKA